MSPLELKEFHKNCTVCTEVHDLIDKYDQLQNAVLKVFDQFMPEHMDSVSNTTCGTDLAKVIEKNR